MKHHSLRIISMFLIAALLASVCPPARAAGENGSFTLAVVTADGVVVEPEAVDYAPGQTVRDALMSSNHVFTGLEQGYIYAVDGVSDSFYLYYGAQQYDLNVPAENVDALLITTNSSGWSTGMRYLLLRLGEYRAMTNGVQNYDPARLAYSDALDVLRFGNHGLVSQVMEALNEAIAEYEAMQAGEKGTVSFSVMQNGTPVSDLHITLTGPYGDVHEARGSEIDVIPGTYSFTVSDGGVNAVKGTTEVDYAGCTVHAELPAGNWFSTVDLLKQFNSEEAFDSEAFSGGARYYLPDCREGSVAFRAVKGENAPQDAVLYVDYIGTDGTDYTSSRKSWNSTATGMNKLLLAGMGGRTVSMRAVSTDSFGNTMFQTYSLEIIRTPTLSNLNVYAEGVSLPLDFNGECLHYTTSTSSDTLRVEPAAFTASGTTVSVNGEVVQSGQSVQVPAQSMTVLVTHTNGCSTEYTVAVEKKDAALVTVSHESHVSVQVLLGENAVPAVSSGSTADQYRLISGMEYTLVATAGEYYHTSVTFTAEDGGTVSAVTPAAQDWLSSLRAANGTTATMLNRQEYLPEAPFDPAVHAYDFHITDMNSSFGLWVNAAPDAGNVSVTALYTQLYDGKTRSVNVTPGNSSGANLSYFVQRTGFSNRAVVRVSKESGGTVYYQDYILNVHRILHLTNLSVTAEGENVALEPEFDRDQQSYVLRFSQGIPEIGLALTFPTPYDSPATSGGYRAVVSAGGVEQVIEGVYGESAQAVLELDTSVQTEQATVTVYHADTDSVSTAYVLQFAKQAPVRVSFDLNPADAVVSLIDTVQETRVWPDENGCYALLAGRTYSYTAACFGYVGTSGSLTARNDETIPLSLTRAPAGQPLPTDLDAQWPSFRGNNENNAVISGMTPVTSDTAVLYWATKLGEGFSNEAVGSPILVDGYLYTYAGRRIYKVDTVTGDVVASGTMKESSSFAINPMTYGDGMVFVGVANGVQAFNAETLESLWLYQDAIGGQPNCNITYRDGYIYTGFWSSEVKTTNYVCLSVTDEDPTDTAEQKIPVWTHGSAGGYYWAGAYVADGFLLVGTDDGDPGYTSGYASVLSLDTHTGKLLDSRTMPFPGDVRSDIAYDAATDAYYFTSKGGYFYKIQADRATGRFVEDSLRYVRLQNGSTGNDTPAMSTSTPVVYNGRAYIGASGTVQFGAYSGHSITVIDLASWKIAYSVPTMGYPQTSGLLTTGYDTGDGTVYVYFFDNYTPGKLRLLKDKPGQTAPSLTTTEVYYSNGKELSVEAGYTLFTPSGAQAEYAICSPIADENGTIYFKNDSGYLMALGCIMTDLSVTRMPDKRNYEPGDVFDPTGMEVTATYANGITRDVTAYVSFSTEPLTEEDDTVIIRFTHMMYHDEDGEIGVSVDAPETFVTLNGTLSPDEMAAKRVAELIDAIGEVDENSGAAIRAAREAYDALTPAQKALVPNYQTLLDAEAAYENLGHEHVWGSWETVTPATTVREGLEKRVCTLCGETDYRAIPVKQIDNPFTDVKENAYYYRAVLWAVDQGITTGTSDTTFSPGKECTRGQIVMFLWRAMGSPEPESTENPFKDVKTTAYYYKAVLWAVENGVTTGTGDGKFSPNDVCSRAAVVMFLWRAMGSPEPESTENPFTDVKTTAYYYKAVLWAVESGITSGGGNGKFMPNSFCTRGQVVTFLLAALG